jgi:DNA repair exonuclease SbcCD ATPase subunit/DNA repair exonuclease SbcCD nuclease subunit
MPKICHLSDTHIKSLKQHDEYTQVFEKIYEHLRNEKVDYIVHTGDIAHTKTQISPEFVDMCGNFFTNLAEIAPLHIILGNHDGNLRNSNRQDAISPIVTALNNPRITLYKNSGEYIVNDTLSFNVLSIFDKEGWVKPSSRDRINIALYHGSINGVITDTGYVIEHGDDVIDIFEGHDYALLGDIHLANQKVDPDGRMRYAGSTLQQNFGETDDKGFLIWNIRDKNIFDVRHICIPNPRPFITIELGLEGEIGDSINLPKGSRIRLVSRNNLSVDRVKNAIDAAKTRFKPESVTYVNKSVEGKENLQEVSSLSKTMNLRDLAVQEEIIRSYLKDYNPDNEALEKIFDMNKRFNSEVEQGEEVARNINWKIKSLEWDNLFNYGEGNKLDFDKLNGVVGIFGKNYTGKSSVIDSLMYTVFNTTSKNNRKNLNIINQNREKGRGKIVFDINGNEYSIERTSEKYIKKSKGAETVEAKTDVIFSEESEDLHNGLDRSDTDKNIRRFVGTVDDFLLTSMASQLNSLAFIGEGSTQRKAILAKFLDLDIFEAKFKLAKGEASEIKAVLKKLDTVDYDSEIEKTKEEIKKSENNIKEQKELSEIVQLALSKKRDELLELVTTIKSMKMDIGSPSELLENKKTLEETVNLVENKIKQIESSIKELQQKSESIAADLLIDIQAVLREKASIDADSKELSRLESDYKLVSQSNNDLTKRISLLSDVPCGDEYSSCKFIRDAFSAKEQKPSIEQQLVQLSTKVNEKRLALDQSRLEDLNKKIASYNSAIALQSKIDLQTENLRLDLERQQEKLLSTNSSLKDCNEKLAQLELKKDLVATLQKLQENEKACKLKINDLEGETSRIQQKITTLYKESGYHVSTLETLEEQKMELAEKRKEFAAYDLYLKAMHPNGISYQVIKDKLPVINAEINKMLANVVEFQIFLVNDDDKLDIMIKHPKYDARPLEMGSGAEKSLASIAIRLAFLNVTSLPKSDIIILDEPGTALDNDNLAGFIRILELIKGYFKTVLLISHLDALKDAVDMQINIDRQGNFAYVNQ